VREQQRIYRLCRQRSAIFTDASYRPETRSEGLEVAEMQRSLELLRKVSEIVCDGRTRIASCQCSLLLSSLHRPTQPCMFITNWNGVFIRITQLLKVLDPGVFQWWRLLVCVCAVRYGNFVTFVHSHSHGISVGKWETGIPFPNEHLYLCTHVQIFSAPPAGATTEYQISNREFSEFSDFLFTYYCDFMNNM